MAMKRTAKLALGLAAVLVVLGLFLLPVVPITVSWGCEGTFAPTCFTSSASASVMYAYSGIGAVQVPVLGELGGHTYCLMNGNPGTMCGYTMQRMG